MPGTVPVDTTRNAGEDLAASASTFRRYRSQHEPSQQGLILVHRRWFRLGVILLVSGVALLAWGLQWYRRPVWWLSVSLVAVLVSWQWPQLGWEAAPWVLLASSAALLVLWIEYATRLSEVPSASESFSDTTRTYWNDAAAEQERSAPPSLSKRSSVVAGDPT